MSPYGDIKKASNWEDITVQAQTMLEIYISRAVWEKLWILREELEWTGV